MMYYMPGITPPPPSTITPKPHIRLKVKYPKIDNTPPPPKWYVVWDDVPEQYREYAMQRTPVFFERAQAESWLDDMEMEHECYGHVEAIHHQ